MFVAFVSSRNENVIQFLPLSWSTNHSVAANTLPTFCWNQCKGISLLGPKVDSRCCKGSEVVSSQDKVPRAFRHILLRENQVDSVLGMGALRPIRAIDGVSPDTLPGVCF